MPEERDTTGDGRGAGRSRWALVAVLVLAALVRLPGYADEAPWADECTTALWASLPAAQLAEQLRTDCQLPLYYVAQAAVTRALGDDPWALRLLSILAGLASVALAHRLGTRSLSPGAGWLAAFLLAVSPMHVHYSREARNYALLVFLVLVSLWAVERLLARPGPLTGLVAGLSFAALAYTHGVAPLLIAPLAVAAVLPAAWGRDRPSLIAWAVAALTALLAHAPWLSVSLGQTSRVEVIYAWARPHWEEVFPWQVVHSLAALSHGSDAPVLNVVRHVRWTAWPAVAVSLLLVVVAWRSRSGWRQPRMAAPLLAALFGPLLLLFVASLAVTPIHVVGRVDAVALPAFVLLVGAGAAASRRPPPWSIALAFAGLAVGPLHDELTLDRRFLDAQMVRRVAAELGPGDTVVLAGPFQPAFRYHLPRAGHDAVLRGFPASRDVQPHWVDWEAHPEERLRREARDLARWAEARARAGSASVWLVLAPDERHQPAVEALSRRLRPTGRVELHWGNLALGFRPRD